ncbi:hypothetical protein AAMO2058_001407500 [Amorphochlora amoebiformis]|eukprot:227874-Amorphochlora_amoeboformis.AAC.2
MHDKLLNTFLRHWKEGVCKRREACTYVHAWIAPAKKGICQRHLVGSCYLSAQSCHYQHLKMPLEKYEALAEGTRNYVELTSKVVQITGDRGDMEEKVEGEKKIFTCQHWLKGFCHWGHRCHYLHAWVNPAKRGVCQKYLHGRCPYTETSCYYQHLRIPLRKYEAFADGTINYEDLKGRVGQFLAFSPNSALKVKPTLEFKNSHTAGVIGPSLSQGFRDSMDEQIPTPYFIRQVFPKEHLKPRLHFGQGSLNMSMPKDNIVNHSLGSLSTTKDSFTTLSTISSSETSTKEYYPSEFLCPITGDLMEEPVSTCVGHTYDRSSITSWLKANDVDPKSGEKLANKELTPNTTLKAQILEWRRGGEREQKKPVDFSPNTTAGGSPRLEVKLKELLDFHSTGSNDGTSDSSDIPTPKGKSLRDWSCEEVYTFVRGLGKAASYEEYANEFLREDVDGSTLSEYTDMETLLKDFSFIKRCHGRKICKAVRKYLSV